MHCCKRPGAARWLKKKGFAGLSTGWCCIISPWVAISSFLLLLKTNLKGNNKNLGQVQRLSGKEFPFESPTSAQVKSTGRAFYLVKPEYQGIISKKILAFSLIQGILHLLCSYHPTANINNVKVGPHLEANLRSSLTLPRPISAHLLHPV